MLLFWQTSVQSKQLTRASLIAKLPTSRPPEGTQKKLRDEDSYLLQFLQKKVSKAFGFAVQIHGARGGVLRADIYGTSRFLTYMDG